MNQRTLTLGSVGVVVLAIIIVMSRQGGEAEADLDTDVAVHTGEIARATLHQYVTAYGYVEPAPEHDGNATAGAILTPLSAGVLAGINAVEGRRVVRGDVLFRLDRRMAEVIARKAEQEVAFAEKAWQRQKLLLPVDGTSERAVQEAQRLLDDARGSLAEAQTALTYLDVTAPISGTVVQLDARIGQAVDGSTVLGRIVDLDRLVVTAGVPVREAANVAAGQVAIIGSDSTAPRGMVQTIGREVDQRSGSYQVQVTVPRRAGLLPGQFTDVRILAGEHRDVLVIPEAGLVTRAGEGSWIVAVEDGQGVRYPVTTGFREAGLVEIIGDGLKPGMIVVTVEAYSLPEHSKVHPVAN